MIYGARDLRTGQSVRYTLGLFMGSEVIQGRDLDNGRWVSQRPLPDPSGGRGLKGVVVYCLPLALALLPFLL